MKIRVIHALMILIAVFASNISNAQPTFSTKQSPVVESYRYHITPTNGTGYYLTYNQSITQVKDGMLVKYSPGLSPAKSATYKSLLTTKYTGLGEVMATDKTLSLFYAGISSATLSGFSVSQYVKQNYNPTTLEPEGKSITMFDASADGFTGKSMLVVKSASRHYTALIVTAGKEFKKCKITLEKDNEEVYSKVFEYGVSTPEISISEGTVTVSDNGNVAFMIYDIVRKGDKAYLAEVQASTEKMKTAPISPEKAVWFPPVITYCKSGDIAVCYSYANNKNTTLRNGFMLEKYTSGTLARVIQNDFALPAHLVEQYNETKGAAKDGAVYGLDTKKIHELDNGHFVVIAEQSYTDNNNDAHDDAMVALAFDEKLKPTYQQYVPKFQTFLSFYTFMGCNSAAIGNKIYLFYNTGNKDAAGKLRFKCTVLDDEKGGSQSSSMLTSPPDFYVAPATLQCGSENKYVFVMATQNEKKYAALEVSITDK